MLSCALCPAGRTLIRPVSARSKVLQWVMKVARRGGSNTFVELQWHFFSLIFLIGAPRTESRFESGG